MERAVFCLSKTSLVPVHRMRRDRIGRPEWGIRTKNLESKEYVPQLQFPQTALPCSKRETNFAKDYLGSHTRMIRHVETQNHEVLP